MFPIVVHEATVRVFNYYFEGQICQGMCCFRKFYRLVNTFSRRDRAQACLAAQALTHRQEQAVITASDQAYKVWLEIRSLDEPEAAETGAPEKRAPVEKEAILDC
ncbi:MAG: hypothetical protein HC781_10460 [Leptolyngbyaceae cyanobacterium CSU_1_4]|nr:hypothetical protein [Leptolyngbyaceae cyanobacterium CSU_1_4]